MSLSTSSNCRSVFSLPLQKYRELLLPFRCSSAWASHTEFYVKVFYVMGKGMSGQLSCKGTGLVMFSYHFSSSAKCYWNAFKEIL